MLVRQDEAITSLDSVSFSNAEQCAQKIERFLGDPDGREAIASTQRKNVRQRLTFEAGMRHVVEQITQRLAAEG